MTPRRDFGPTDIARQNAAVLTTVGLWLVRLLLPIGLVGFAVTTAIGLLPPRRHHAESLVPSPRGGVRGRVAPTPHRDADGDVPRHDARVARALSRRVRPRGARRCHCGGAGHRPTALPSKLAYRIARGRMRRCRFGHAVLIAIPTPASSVSFTLRFRSRPWLRRRAWLSARTLGVPLHSQVIERRSL